MEFFYVGVFMSGNRLVDRQPEEMRKVEIETNINKHTDLFGRSHTYIKKDKNKIFPQYLLNQLNKHKEFFC